MIPSYFKRNDYWGKKRYYYEAIEKYCLQGFKSIAIVGSLPHIALTNRLRYHNLHVTEIDHDYFKDRARDVLRFHALYEPYAWSNHDLIIVMCGEHIYPLSKTNAGHYIYMINKHPDPIHRACTNEHSDLGMLDTQITECENVKMVIGDQHATRLFDSI